MSAARARTSKKRKSASKKTAPKSEPARKSRAKTKPARAGKAMPEAGAVNEPRATESDLIMTWFRLLARCRGAWLQQLWMADGSMDGRATVTHAELAGILADQDSLEAEREWSLNQEPIRRWKAEADEVRRAIDSLENSRLARLANVFGLGREELDLLQLCAAVAFDPALARVAAYLQDHSGRTYLTENLAARLLGLGDGGTWTPEMNVFRWEFIHRHDTGVGEPVALVCDPQIKEWLLGRSTLDEPLIGAARLVRANGSQLPEWPVDEVSKWIDQMLRSAESLCLRVVVVAPQGGGKRKFAAAVSAALGMPLLIVNANATDESNWPRLFLHAQRQVFLDTAALAWTGDAVGSQPWPANQVLFPIQFVLAEPGHEPPTVTGTIDRHVQLPMPQADTREKLWLDSSQEARSWPVDELHKLAERHSVWPGDIELASRLGATSPAEAALHVREHARSRFGNLAQILECPFEWDDLVLPEGVKQFLEAIAFEAEERGSFWRQDEARRLFPQGRGLIALFSGPSGTGKTMATQVIAGRLTQDLCRVNVAQLVSKWVGETPKNVEKVIRVAAENNVVLFFDEADALFGRRSTEIRDAQDKFANTDSAFLLQAIESYPGIAILATNLKTNIDAAFLRRIRFVVEFPKPTPALQCVLWKKLVTALADEERAKALESTFELLSASTDATGAQIKFALLSALFIARSEVEQLNARHLLTGLDRELAKEGRAIGPRERDRILKMGEAA